MNRNEDGFGGLLAFKEKKGGEESVAVKDVTTDDNAGGVRPAVADELVAATPAEFAICTTGHSVRDFSALFEYVRSRHALSMPGAIIVTGWPPLPWGQLGYGSVPASFKVLLDEVGLTKKQVDEFVDELFFLDSASHPMLRKGGKLRELPCAAAASLIMYYEESVNARPTEMPGVQARLRDIWATTFARRGAAATGSGLGAPSVLDSPSAHLALVSWGNLIRHNFNRANLHLTSREGASGVERMVAAVAQLQFSLAESRRAA